MLTDPNELTILLPAFCAGLLILLSHIPLGREVLKRGIIFIDLAVAQIAGLGVITAALLGWTTHGWEVQLLAVGSALAGAALLNTMEKYWPTTQEALIGICFVLAATGSILLLSGNPHGGESLKDLLVGQILWITWQQVALLALVTLAIGGIWLFFRQRKNASLFYILFAIAITSSVQLVGVYLVFASLIIPALAAIRHTGKPGLAVAYATGSGGYALGLLLSLWFDLPAGAIIVWAIAACALFVGIGSYLLENKHD